MTLADSFLRQFLTANPMVPFSDTALRHIFRVFDVNVAPYITTAVRRGAQGWYRNVTFEGISRDWDRNSKVRARHGTRTELLYNFISRVYRLGPKLRPASVPPHHTRPTRASGPLPLGAVCVYPALTLSFVHL